MENKTLVETRAVTGEGGLGSYSGRPIKGDSTSEQGPTNQLSTTTQNRAFQHFSYVSTSSSTVLSRYLVQLHVFPYKHLLLQAFSFQYFIFILFDRPKTRCVKCTPICASARVAPSNIVYQWYGYRSTRTGVLTTNIFAS